MEAAFLFGEPVAFFLLMSWLGFLHSAIALGRVLHSVTLFAGDDREHVVGYLVLVMAQREFGRSAEGRDGARAAARSDQVVCVLELFYYSSKRVREIRRRPRRSKSYGA
jgi:hypothetical protein